MKNRSVSREIAGGLLALALIAAQAIAVSHPVGLAHLDADAFHNLFVIHPA